MNCRFSAALVACGLALGGVSWGDLTLSSVAFGQSPPASVLPPGVQTNAQESPSDKLAISKFVQDQFVGLSGSEFAAQTAARKALLAQLSRGSTPAYYAEFSRAWSTAAMAALEKSPPVSVRLNIGIVTQALADNGSIIDPEPLVDKLIDDKDPCVALWGIKAAKPLVIVLLTLPHGSGKPPVLSHPTAQAVVDAVKRHGNSEIAGLIAADAYSALVVNAIPDVTPQQMAGMVPPLVEPLLDILEFRLSQYKNGVPAPGGKLTGPQNPGAEHAIGTFLSTSYGSPLLTVADQHRIVQDLVDLLTYVGERAALYQNNKDDLAEIRDMMRYAASPLRVLVPSAYTGLGWFVPAPPACKPDEILEHTSTVYGLIAKDPAFTWLLKPADVVPIEPPAPLDAPKTAAGAAGTPAAPAR